ncbi:hypothetical protein ATO8_19954 [Roseivivax marinus]|uniref:Uncharacterized protein n=1 Tax=Roseivivax marinus TaxID=1379903 RepID=W4HFJ9_9RHOB|nr:hypothetical protein [Roseivivax marinus]ETW10906.1 hypothetical protein ATO8_19954 [Roseivivax marinus]
MRSNEELQALADDFTFPVNLTSTGDVVTDDGVVLGTWRERDDDGLYLYEFFPEGATEPAIASVWKGHLALEVRDLHEAGGL